MAIRNFGIDLSYANIINDYNALVDSKYNGYKIKYAFLRLGYIDRIDRRFMEHYKALHGKIPLGVYVYSYARSADEARTEAIWALREINERGIELEFPVAFDYEDVKVLSPRLSRERYTAICKAFLDTVADAGYYPLLYCNPSFLESYADKSALSEYPLWLAHYTADGRQGQYGQKIWQFGTFRPSGAVGPVDGNFAYEQLGKYIRENKLNRPASYRITAEKTTPAWERFEDIARLKEMGFSVREDRL